MQLVVDGKKDTTGQVICTVWLNEGHLCTMPDHQLLELINDLNTIHLKYNHPPCPDK
jgi:hypothetical protein